MSAKLLMHTALCFALVMIFAYREREVYRCRDTRLWRTRAMLLASFWLGLSPWLYRVNGLHEVAPWLFSRVTIHPAQLMILAASVYYFSPRRKVVQPYESDTDYTNLPAEQTRPDTHNSFH